jgi:flagellar hook-associated protein 1 FlgK
MSNLNSLLSIGRSALSASQSNIQVTGNNIANIDTEGYSRQSVVLVTGDTITAAPGELGTGVIAQEVVRSYDALIESQYLNQISVRDRWKALYTNLSNVQNLVNESNTDGINASMSTMFSDWGDLTSSTASNAALTTMLGDTDTLLSLLRSTADSLQKQEDTINQAITADVTTLNTLADDIAGLNKEINQKQIDGVSIPNSLYDLRDSKVEALASLVDINVVDNGKGNYRVSTTGGAVIVDGMVSYEFKMEQGKTVRQLTSASSTANSDVQAYFTGQDSVEYTLQVVNPGTTNSGATFQASLDGGKTWLTDESGNVAVFQANSETGRVKVGDLDVWFGTTSDSSVTSASTLNTGDKFTLVPKTALYWYTSAGTAVNITPQPYADGTDNTNRLTGGALCGAFTFRDASLGDTQATLDAMTETMVWEINRIHSQGAAATAFTSDLGTYSVEDTSVPLGSNTAGLTFGARLQSGASMLHVYDADGNLDFSGSFTFDPSTDSLQDVVTNINTAFAGHLTASIVNNRLSLSADGAGTFQFGDDSSGLYAALGLNTLLTGSTATDVALNGVVTNDTSKICLGHVGSGGLVASGDITTATAIAALQNKEIDYYQTGKGTDTQTLGNYYDNLVGKVGSDTSSASYQTTYQTTLATQINEQKLAISGVSLDEELTNLIKFQHSYQAAAKLISTADDMMTTVLGLKN